MQMQTIWYVLIHVSLGLIGWKIFTFTNQGVLAAFAACAGVQAWPMYEMYRLTWEKFDSMRSRRTGSVSQKKRPATTGPAWGGYTCSAAAPTRF